MKFYAFPSSNYYGTAESYKSKKNSKKADHLKR